MVDRMQVIIKYTIDESVIAAYKYLSESEDIYSNPFLGYNWVLSMANAYDKNNIFILIKNKNKFIAACALRIDKQKFLMREITTLRFINNNIADYNGIIYTKKEKASQIAKYFIRAINSIKNIDCIDLDNLQQNCHVSTEILSQLRFNFKKYYIIPRSECPKLILDRSEIDILKKNKQDTLRCLKRLEENYSVEIFVNQKIEEKDLEVIMNIKEDTYGKHDLSIPQNFKILLESIKNGIQYDYSYIKCNNDIIAAHFGLIDNDTVYYYIPTFNRDFSKYAVGNILLLSLIEHYKNKNYKTFDFLRGGELYKKNWSSVTLKNQEALISLNKKGYIYITYIALRRILSKVKQSD